MNEQDYITFEAFLSGELSGADLEVFENRLNQDPEFKEAFSLYKETTNFLEHKFSRQESREKFKTQVQRASDQHFAKEILKSKKEKRFVPWQYGVAAAIVLLIGFFTQQRLTDPSYEDYAHYGRVELTVRGEQGALVSAAQEAFNEGEYDQANEAFEQLLHLNSQNTEYQFYKALTDIELGYYEGADSMLKGIAQGKSAYKNKALWFLALSQLKQGKKQACIEVLKTMPQEAEDYSLAQKLLKKLD